MSFGPSSTTKTAENNLAGTSNLALNNQFPQVTDAAKGMMGLGASTTAPGVDFFKNLLGGNQANTVAALQPNIDQIRSGVNSALTGINTLAPRGGGRAGANYGMAFAPQSQISNLFNNARTQAASALPQIGLQESGLGANLFGIGNQALGTAGSVNSNLAQIGQQQQQITNSLWGNLGKGIFGLATTPFGGGAAANGLFGLL